jgi:hypothetical protein
MRSYPKKDEERDGQIGVYTYLRELGAASATIRPSQGAKRTEVPRPEDPGIRRRVPAAARASGRVGATRKGLARTGLASKGLASKKDHTVPGRVGPGAGRPGAGRPGAGRSGAGRSGAGRPGAGRPGAGTGVGGGGGALVWPVSTEPAPATIGPYVQVAVVEG